MIESGKAGVGFGVGKESIPDYLASKGVSCLITDLDIDRAKEKGWVDTNQHSRDLSEMRGAYNASNSEFFKNVKHRFVDMNAIPNDIKDFDFCWSACALEHLGSIELGIQFIKNSLNCIKPGGLAVHTTEFNLSSLEETVDNMGTVLFRKKDIEKLKNDLQAEGHQIEISYHSGDQPLDVFYDMPPYSQNNHLKLLLGNFITTSIGLTILKKK
ncbi:MAG: hypothetical protein R2827_13510 [Bdellovibrionales bacterium]